MGNASTTAKGAAALANVKSQANTMLNKLDEPDKKKKVIENPETRRKMNQRHRERDTEWVNRLYFHFDLRFYSTCFHSHLNFWLLWRVWLCCDDKGSKKRKKNAKRIKQRSRKCGQEIKNAKRSVRCSCDTSWHSSNDRLFVSQYIYCLWYHSVGEVTLRHFYNYRLRFKYNLLLQFFLVYSLSLRRSSCEACHCW